MVPRLVFAALVFCSLASRPEGASPRRRAASEPHRVQPPPAPAPPVIGPAGR